MIRDWLRFVGGPARVELMTIGARGSRFARVGAKQVSALLAQADADPTVHGAYARVNPPSDALPTVDRWAPAGKGATMTADDVERRSAIYVDVDAVRPSGTSATDAEKACAHALAMRVHAHFAATVGPDCLGFGDSGNGHAVFVALDALPETQELRARIKDLLARLAMTYQVEGAAIDVKVFDAGRLCPAFGTRKRKGEPSAERPHRATAFTCAAHVRRLGADDLDALFEGLAELATKGPKASKAAKGSTSKISTDPAHWHPYAERVRRGRAYVAAMPDRSPETKNSGWNVAMVLMRGFALELEDAREIFREYNDRSDPPRTEAEIDHKLVSALERGTVPMGYLMEGGEASDRPTIELTHEIHIAYREALAALAKAADLYERGGSIVAIDGATQSIRPLGAAGLRVALSAAAKWTKYDGRSDAQRPCTPTDHIVYALAESGPKEGLRPLEGVSSAPFMRPDGTILDRPGYDPATSYVYAPTADFGSVAECPTLADAEQALADLREPFADFEHADEAARMVPIAAILTLLARPAIMGPVPAFIFDAAARGAGKSLQAAIVSLIGTGSEETGATFPGGREADAELTKLLSGYVSSAPPLLAFDDLAGATFSGSALNKVLTANGPVEFRRLGKSETIRHVWRTVILATGNNVTIGDDTSRRVIVSRLVPSTENPEERDGFAIPALLPWARGHRARLVRAALTLLRAYVVAGRPRMELRHWGSFEAWASLVPSAIVWAGGADVMTTRPTLQASGGAGGGAMGAIWEGLARMGQLTSRDIIRTAYMDGQYAAMRDALESVLFVPDGGQPNAKMLGRYLMRHRDRVVGGLRLIGQQNRKCIQVWTARAVNGTVVHIDPGIEALRPVVRFWRAELAKQDAANG